MNLINFPQRSNQHIVLKYMGNKSEHLPRSYPSHSPFCLANAASLEIYGMHAGLKDDRGMRWEGPIYSIK